MSTYSQDELKILIKAMGDKLHHPEQREMPKNLMVARMENELSNISGKTPKDQSTALEKLSKLVDNFLNRLQPETKNSIMADFKKASIPKENANPNTPQRPTWTQPKKPSGPTPTPTIIMGKK